MRARRALADVDPATGASENTAKQADAKADANDDPVVKGDGA
jgi:hypothetical protein